jgi:hypothetical protein
VRGQLLVTLRWLSAHEGRLGVGEGGFKGLASDLDTTST